jgi:hypothetical protein
VTQSSERAEVRAALQAIMSDPSLGQQVLWNRSLMAGVIKDYLPDAPRETGILLAAVEHGVPETLRGHLASGMDTPTAISRTASWFADRTMYAPDASNWVVGEIALAMGLSTPAEPGVQAQPPQQSPPQWQPQAQAQWQPQPQPQAQWQAQPQAGASPQWQPQPQAQWQPQPQPQAQWQAQPYTPPQPQFAAGGAGDVTVVPGQPGPFPPAAQAPGPGQPRRRRMLPFLIAGVVVVLVAGGVTGVLLLRSKPKPKPTVPVKPVISIAASSPLVVGSDVVVAYHDGNFAHATISSDLSRTKPGEIAKLLALPFPFKSSQARFVGTQGISARSERVTFSVTPTLETEYIIGVFRSSSAAKDLASSKVQTIYVTTADIVKFGYSQQSCNSLACSHLTQCIRPDCYVNYLIRVYVPPSAIKTEVAKHLYHYFALNLSKTGRPKVPKTLFLSPKVKPTVTKTIAPNEYEWVVPTEFHVGNEGYSFKYAFCTRDTLSADGLGLPGHHGCGNASVPVSARYLG